MNNEKCSLGTWKPKKIIHQRFIRGDLGTRVSLGRHVAPKHTQKLVTRMRPLDSKIFHFISLFICVRCFNPFDDRQYDIDWGGPVSLREGQVTPVSLA